MVETNLLGVLYATHVFVDDLCADGGDVVNLSSVAGRKARPATNVYAATKHAVTGWSGRAAGAARARRARDLR